MALYIDEFEICNPLGTSRKIHKVTAVYWVLLNLPAKLRSSLTSIQLAVLGKSEDVKRYGYDKLLEPLYKDIRLLEEHGIFVEVVGQFVKGAIFCVCADNLAAHSLAGFQESFNVEKFCRFCLVSRDQIAVADLTDFPLRDIGHHNTVVEALVQNDRVQSICGVRNDCVLRKKLLFFHPITAFPPDILHDLFEGVVPVELSLCLKHLISKGYITFDVLNDCIKSFPYQFSDKINKPQKIPKASFEKGTIGGNGHENWTLLRLLPFIIGSKIPEQEPAWEILMDLKEIVDIAVSNKLSEEALFYFSSKLRDHRKLLVHTFPEFKLKPKHHFIDHYPDLIRCYGPLVELWTMRFEAKHSFFKKVIHDAHNWKNVLLTLSSKHQQMMALHLDRQKVFAPRLYVECVKVVRVSELETSFQCEIQKKYPHLDSVSLSKSVHLHGTRYAEGMIVSAGQCSGLPEFHKIVALLVVAEQVTLICKRLTSWYIDHFRSYELVEGHCVELILLEQELLADYHPLAAYAVAGKLMVTTRTFILQ